MLLASADPKIQIKDQLDASEMRVSLSEAGWEERLRKESESSGSDSVFVVPTSGLDTNKNIYSINEKNLDFAKGKLPVKNLLLENLASQNALRNMSYQMATHESMMNDTHATNDNDSVFINFPPKIPGKMAVVGGGGLMSPTINKEPEQTVIIEEDSTQPQMVYKNKTKQKKNPVIRLLF